jgi:hypothetical protein
MKPRSLVLPLILLLAGTGCTLLDRDSYSLMIRKPAHIYEPPKAAVPEPKMEPLDEEMDPADVADLDGFVRHDLDALIEGIAPRLEPFQPFSYCYLHESSHWLESIVAIALAPVEYPVALATNFTYLTIDTTIQVLLLPLEALFPPPEPPPTYELRRKPIRQ